MFLAVMSLVFLLITSCGKNPDTVAEQECIGDSVSCSESAINAPISPNDPPLDDDNRENEKGRRVSYRMPAFKASWGMKESVYREAVAYYNTHASSLSVNRYVTIIDFSQHSKNKRFYLFDLATGNIERYQTSHGVNSDKNNDGHATSFSNQVDSKESSLGAYLTRTTYHGRNGYSLRLNGLSPTNSNAARRAIVIHPAPYVKDTKVGRSWGCPALNPMVARYVINKIKGGSLIYAGI